MPDRLAIAEIADRLAGFHHIGDHVDLRMLLVERFAIWVGPGRIEVAEAPAERQQLWVREALAVENDDQPFAPCVFDGVDVGLRDRLRQVDAADFRPQWGV
jgi:hypothetical protein